MHTSYGLEAFPVKFATMKLRLRRNSTEYVGKKTVPLIKLAANKAWHVKRHFSSSVGFVLLSMIASTIGSISVSLTMGGKKYA
jgi:hypothetical protein